MTFIPTTFYEFLKLYKLHSYFIHFLIIQIVLYPKKLFKIVTCYHLYTIYIQILVYKTFPHQPPLIYVFNIRTWTKVTRISTEFW